MPQLKVSLLEATGTITEVGQVVLERGEGFLLCWDLLVGLARCYQVWNLDFLLEWICRFETIYAAITVSLLIE